MTATSVGADSTIAPLFAVGVARLAASGTPRYEELVGILAVMVGALVALVWLARLGWISDLLSAPIIAGFLAGIAIIIIVHQLPDLLGVHAAGGSTLHRIGSVISDLDQLSVPTLVIGLGVFVLLIGAERVGVALGANLTSDNALKLAQQSGPKEFLVLNQLEMLGVDRQDLSGGQAEQ